jgi:serine phosphatase RsbU (regulator of sigma subunit)
MIERRLYDLVERASEQERTGSFGIRLMQEFYLGFARDLALAGTELWQKTGNDVRCIGCAGENRSLPEASDMLVHFKRHKRLNPFWPVAPVGAQPAALVAFGRRQRMLLVLHFHAEDLGADHHRIEDAILLLTRMLTMFVQKHEQRDRLNEILALAMEQQLSLLPKSPPPFPGFDLFSVSVPAEEVGGDYHQLDLISSDVMAVTIADAKGRGFSAAVQVTALHHALRIVNREALRITARAERLNQAFCDGGECRNLISAVIGELYQDGRFLYVNASHPYPLLRRRRNGGLLELDDGGLFLGLMPDAKYRFGLLQLEPGDVLFLYTDGISEGHHEQQDQMARVRQALLENAESPLTELAHSVMRLTGENEYQDDRTLILIRRL